MQQNARVFKWKEMFKDYPDKVHKKLHTRGRKGIPNSLRGFAWCLLTDANTSGHKVMSRRDSIVGSLSASSLKGKTAELMKGLMAKEGNKQVLYDIHKDVSRTLPNHIYF